MGRGEVMSFNGNGFGSEKTLTIFRGRIVLACEIDVGEESETYILRLAESDLHEFIQADPKTYGVWVSLASDPNGPQSFRAKGELKNIRLYEGE